MAYVSYEIGCGCGPARFGCVCCRIWKNFKRTVRIDNEQQDVSNKQRWRGWWKKQPEVTPGGQEGGDDLLSKDREQEMTEAETEEQDSQVPGTASSEKEHPEERALQ